MGPPRPAPSHNRPARGKRKKQSGWSSQVKRGPKKQGRSLQPHLNNPTEEFGTDIGKILSESFRFSSDHELGLELVDILSNATRRALIGNLGEPGWKKIPKLIHRGQHYVRMLALMKREPPDSGCPYMSVLRDFSKGGRNMLLPHFYKDRRRSSQDRRSDTIPINCRSR
jgi:hypothetical protein